jgi:hypothetical protein
MNMFNSINDSFEKQMVLYWTNLSRSTNLFVILNISMFFLTEMVITKGYFYTFYSLGLLLAVKIGLLVPFGLLNRLWFYCLFLFLEILAVYFLASSIWYWVATNRV